MVTYAEAWPDGSETTGLTPSGLILEVAKCVSTSPIP